MWFLFTDRWLFDSKTGWCARIIICRTLCCKLYIMNQILALLSSKSWFFIFLDRRFSWAHLWFLFCHSWGRSGLELHILVVKQRLSSLNSSKNFLDRSNFIQIDFISWIRNSLCKWSSILITESLLRLSFKLLGVIQFLVQNKTQAFRIQNWSWIWSNFKDNIFILVLLLPLSSASWWLST